MVFRTPSDPSLPIPAICDNDRGAALITALLVMTVLAVLGTAAIMTASIETLISGNYRTAAEAFYLAEAGTEHGREVLRVLNATSVDASSFTEELGSRVGGNGVLDGFASGTDDVPLIHAAALGNGSYTVYLTNDAIDGPSNTTDSNRRVTLTSVATGPNGSRATIEITVTTFQLFPFPATITLLGTGASFTGGNSNAKELHGDDQCGADPPKPVVAVSDAADVAGVQSSIASSKPETYHTTDAGGNDVTASDDPNAIAAAIPASTLNDIKNTYGIDLLDPAGLYSLVTTLQTLADTVAPDGSSASTVDVGTPGDPKVVVVNGDFNLNGEGVGMLVVTGTLTFQGNVDYTGLILVIGDGVMQRNGGGNGTISGGILIANISGPDGVPGTADDTLGAPTFDTSGGGNANVEYCSTAINNPLHTFPLHIVAFRQL